MRHTTGTRNSIVYSLQGMLHSQESLAPASDFFQTNFGRLPGDEFTWESRLRSGEYTIPDDEYTKITNTNTSTNIC